MRRALELRAEMLAKRINLYARLLGQPMGKAVEEKFLTRIDELEAELARVMDEISTLPGEQA